MVSLINIVNEERIYVNKPSIYTYINLFYQSGTLKNSFIEKRYVSQSENSLDVQPLRPNAASYDENITQFTIQPHTLSLMIYCVIDSHQYNENAIKVQKYNTAETGVGLIRNKLGGSNLP